MSNKGNITETENDPHPSNNRQYDRQERPGGANPPRNDIYPNDAIHDGHPKPRTEKSGPGSAGK